MNIITLDFETYYDQDHTLSKMTTEEYVRDPRFEVHGVAVKYAADGDPHWYNRVPHYPPKLAITEPRIYHACRLVGGLEAIYSRTEEREPWMKKEFYAAWSAYVQTFEHLAQLEAREKVQALPAADDLVGMDELRKVLAEGLAKVKSLQ